MSKTLTTVVAATCLSMIGAASAAQDISAVVSATRTAVLSSLKGGLITDLPVSLGQSVRQGDVIAQFDCAAERADLAAADADLKIAAIETLTQRTLVARGAGGRAAVTTAVAREALRQAERDRVAVDISRCEVRAPFAGRVSDITARAHEIVQSGAPLLELVDPASLELEIIVPTEWVPQMRIGSQMTFEDIATGQSHAIRIDKIAPKIDGASQTLRVIAVFVAPPTDLFSGSAGYVRLN